MQVRWLDYLHINFTKQIRKFRKPMVLQTAWNKAFVTRIVTKRRFFGNVQYRKNTFTSQLMQSYTWLTFCIFSLFTDKHVYCFGAIYGKNNFRLHFSDGHALTKRLSKQVKTCSLKIKTNILEHNACQEVLSSKTKLLLKALNFDDDVENCVGQNNDDWPVLYYVKPQAINMLQLRRHGEEEKRLIK